VVDAARTAAQAAVAISAEIRAQVGIVLRVELGEIGLEVRDDVVVAADHRLPVKLH
jgi:hypothetical protein